MNVRATSLTTNYNHTLEMTAGRELEQKGRTLHLASVDVKCTVETDDRDRTQFELHWNVDQEANEIALATIETPNDDSAPADRLSVAAELADDVVHEFLVDVGLDMSMTNPLTTPGVRGRADVFADLEVTT